MSIIGATAAGPSEGTIVKKFKKRVVVCCGDGGSKWVVDGEVKLEVEDGGVGGGWGVVNNGENFV